MTREERKEVDEREEKDWTRKEKNMGIGEHCDEIERGERLKGERREERGER